MPGENDSAVCLSLFDRQLPTYLALPEPTQGRGQVVITSGDVLLRFDPAQVRFAQRGRHRPGVLRPPAAGEPPRRILLRAGRRGPAVPAEALHRRAEGTRGHRRLRPVLSRYRRDALRCGHGGPAAATFRRPAGQERPPGLRRTARASRHGAWTRLLSRNLLCHGPAGAAWITTSGPPTQSGSKWTAAMLGELFETLSAIPFNVQLLKHCEFLDFGMNRSHHQQRHPPAPGGPGRLAPAGLSGHQQRNRLRRRGPGLGKLGGRLPDSFAAGTGRRQRRRRHRCG